MLLTLDVVVDAVARVPPNAAPRKPNSRELGDMTAMTVVGKDASLNSDSIYAIQDCAPRVAQFAVVKRPHRMSDKLRQTGEPARCS